MKPFTLGFLCFLLLTFSPLQALHTSHHLCLAWCTKWRTTQSATPHYTEHPTTQNAPLHRTPHRAPCSPLRRLSPRWQMLWRRDIDAELSGAEDLRYQEAYDESDGLMAQFRPKSAEAEAAAAQAAAEAEAEAEAAEAEAEADAETESGVEGSPGSLAAAGHATGLWRRASRDALSPKSAPPSRLVSVGIRHLLLQPSLSPSPAGAVRRRLARRQSMPPPLARGSPTAQSPTTRSSLPTKKWRGLVLDARLASVTGSSAGPEPPASALAGQSTPAGQGAAAGVAADGATTAHAARALHGGSCASVLESGGEEDSCESAALPLSSGAAAEGAITAASSAAPRTDEGLDESDEDEDDEGEEGDEGDEGDEAEAPLPQVLSQRWNSLRWSVLAAVRAPQPRPADEGQAEGSTRELI